MQTRVDASRVSMHQVGMKKSLSRRLVRCVCLIIAHLFKLIIYNYKYVCGDVDDENGYWNYRDYEYIR